MDECPLNINTNANCEVIYCNPSFGLVPELNQPWKFNWKQTHDLVKDKMIGTFIWTKGIVKIKSKNMSQPYPWAHKQLKNKHAKMLKENMRFGKSKGSLKQKKMWKIKGKHFGWKYPWWYH